MTPEKALETINRILFPPLRDSHDFKHKVNGDACLGLDGALFDLKRLEADRVCIRTIERTLQKLMDVKKVLQEAGLNQPSEPA